MCWMGVMSTVRWMRFLASYFQHNCLVTRQDNIGKLYSASNIGCFIDHTRGADDDFPAGFTVPLKIGKLGQVNRSFYRHDIDRGDERSFSIKPINSNWKK